MACWNAKSTLFVDSYLDWLVAVADSYPFMYDDARKYPLFLTADPNFEKAIFGSDSPVETANTGFEPDTFLYSADKLSDRDEAGLVSISGFADFNTIKNLAVNEVKFSLPDRDIRSASEEPIRQPRIIPCQVLPEDAVCNRPKEELKKRKKVKKQKPVKDKIASDAVIVGIIDEGIAFANERFCTLHQSGNLDEQTLKTRVEYAWIQDGKCFREYNDEPLYGKEYCKSEIDIMLIDCQSNEVVDEDKFYKQAGLVDHSRSGLKSAARRLAHGTHVMDLACGYELGKSPKVKTKGPDEGQDARPIISVQLPTRTVADTSGLGLEKFFLDGVKYILKRARQMAVDRGVNYMPVVINFSSGIFAGPHDGKHPLEIEIDALLQKERKETGCNIELVLPAGNSNLSQTHARIDLTGGNRKKPQTMTWRVQPDDKTFNFMEIWLPKGKSSINDHVAMIVEPPNCTAQTILSWCEDNENGHFYELKTVCETEGEGKTLAKIYSEAVDRGNGDVRERFMIITAPTASYTEPVPTAPSGDWKISFENMSNENKTIHAWIQWDDRPLNYPVLGRQSYFVDENYDKYDSKSGRLIQFDNSKSYIKRDGTINALATGEETIVVGGHVRKDHWPTSYSSSGEAGTGISQPTATTITDTSLVLQGILAAGTKSGSVAAMNGTSVAAPQVTRQLADTLSKASNRAAKPVYPSLGKQEIIRVAKQNQASREPHIHAHPKPREFGDPNRTERIGNGRLRRTTYSDGGRSSQVDRIKEW